MPRAVKPMAHARGLTQALASALALVAAGCAAPAESIDDPRHTEGTFVLSEQAAAAVLRRDVTFDAPAGASILARLRVENDARGSPGSLDAIEARLLDASGAVLAHVARATTGGDEVALSGVATTSGEGRLELTFYATGGPGARVAYVIDVR